MSKRAPAFLVALGAMVHPEWDRVREAGAELLRTNKKETLTWGQFKRKLAAALDIDVLLLQAHRSALHELIQNANDQSSEGDSQSEAEEDEESGSEEEEEEQETDGMVAMRALARAMNLGYVHMHISGKSKSQQA